jgi:hypothetical protein
MRMRYSSYNPFEEKKSKRRAYLRDWTLVSNGGKWASLHGSVYGHDRFMDGERIITSPLLKFDIPGCSAETMNTIYVLRDDRRPG